MSYRPFSLPSSHSAARTAPRAKVMRLEALWVISTRSPLGGEQHGVVAHYVAGAHGGEADGFRARAPVCPSRP